MLMAILFYRINRILQDENFIREQIALEPVSELELEAAHMKSGAWLDDFKKVQKRYRD
jgi:hypothetical protein